MERGNLYEKTKEFFEYNKDNIFKNLLEAEHHAKMLTGEIRGGHANCIIKHLLFVEGEAEEAINHSEIVSPEKAETFKMFRDMVYALRKAIMKGRIRDPIDLNRKIWVLRKVFESFNEEYDTTKCTACEAMSYFNKERELETLEKVS